jgi:hypothetical protein
LYGWDAENQFWYGPAQLARRSTGTSWLTRQILRCPAAFHGSAPCEHRDGSTSNFLITAHDVGDCALATIDLAGAGAGPLEVLAAVPHHRLSHLRPDFAFELTAFARFYGSRTQTGAELAIHDAIEATLATDRSSDIVFSIGAHHLDGDIALALSPVIESLAVALVAWTSPSRLGMRQARAAS